MSILLLCKREACYTTRASEGDQNARIDVILASSSNAIIEMGEIRLRLFPASTVRCHKNAASLPATRSSASSVSFLASWNPA